jgi:hypothetical protein
VLKLPKFGTAFPTMRILTHQVSTPVLIKYIIRKFTSVFVLSIDLLDRCIHTKCL